MSIRGIVSWLVKGFIALVVIIFVIGFVNGFLYGSNPATVQSTENPPAYSEGMQITATIPQIRFSSYMDPAFTMRVPGSWTYSTEKDPKKEYITYTSFFSDDGTAEVHVQVEDITGVQDQYVMSTLHDWKVRGVQIIRGRSDLYPESTIIQEEKGTVDGYPAQIVEFTYGPGGAARLHRIQYLIDPGPFKGYQVIFSSREEIFNDWSDTRQEMINSFQIIG